MQKSSLSILSMLFLSTNALSLHFDYDVPEKIKTQIRADLEFASTIQGSAGSNLHAKIFGKFSGEVYKDFFNSRVDQIGLDDCGNPYAIACVKQFLLETSKMWITPNYMKYGHPQMARLMVLFHEARHTELENSNWTHATCPTPFNDSTGEPIKSIWTGNKLAGREACDRTSLGSYGISIVFLKNIAKYCSNCTEKVLMDANLYGDDQFQRIIDQNARVEIQTDIY